MPAAEQTRMFREAGEAAAAVARQLERNEAMVSALAAELRAAPPSFVATCARGSSDHAATYAKYLFGTRLGRVTASVSPSVNSLYAAPQHLEAALYLVISQSGRSPDLVASARAARRAGARVVALVNVEDSPLAAAVEYVIPLHAGIETSVAASKSFLCALAAIAHLTARWSEDPALAGALSRLPADLDTAWVQDWSPCVDGLIDARDLYVVGRGPGLAAAQEIALKFKETCGLHAEAYSAAEVRHGPMALVEAGFPVLCLAQRDDTWGSSLALAEEFRGRGARVWLAAPDATGIDALAVATTHPAMTPIVAVHSFYRAVNALALRRGRDPDTPPHLRKITETV